MGIERREGLWSWYEFLRDRGAVIEGLDKPEPVRGGGRMGEESLETCGEVVTEVLAEDCFEDDVDRTSRESTTARDLSWPPIVAARDMSWRGNRNGVWKQQKRGLEDRDWIQDAS